MSGFEWGPEKARSNLAKHGIAFEEAKRVWDDPELVVYVDRVIDNEQRWRAVGIIGLETVLFVVLSIAARLMKNGSASSAQEERLLGSAKIMPKQTYDAEQRARLAKIGEMPDEDIDLSDIPEADDAIWKYARRPNLGEALVLPVAIEAKVFAWFARHSDTPENDLNNVLRQHIADADAKSSDAKTRKRRA